MQASAMAAIGGGEITVIILGLVLAILQVFTAKAENKRTGLIIPIILFGISLATTAWMIWDTVNTSYKGMINGVLVDYAPSMSTIISQAVLVFLLCNIATGVSIAIYAVCRSKINKHRALEMMNVQDLG